MSLILADNPNVYNDVPVVQSIGNKKVETYTTKSVRQRREFVIVQPATAISSNIYQGQQADFLIQNCIDRISSVYLKWDYINSSGANFVAAANTDSVIQSIQIFSGSGTNLLYQSTTNVESYLINNFLLSRNEYETTALLRGYYSPVEQYPGGTSTIANGAAGSLYFPIALNFFRSTHFRPYDINGNLLIRILFNPAATNITSGTWTTTSLSIEISGYNESDAQQNMILAKATVPKAFSYYAPQRSFITMALTTAGNQNSFKLTGIRGWVSVLFFTIRTSTYATSPVNQFAFTRCASFDILDSGNQSVTGFKQQTENDMILMASHMFDNRFINYTNAHVWSFSQTPVSDIATGQNNGCVWFDGFNSLVWYMPTTITATNYDIAVYAMCNESIIINGANVSSTRA